MFQFKREAKRAALASLAAHLHVATHEFDQTLRNREPQAFAAKLVTLAQNFVFHLKGFVN